MIFMLEHTQAYAYIIPLTQNTCKIKGAPKGTP